MLFACKVFLINAGRVLFFSRVQLTFDFDRYGVDLVVSGLFCCVQNNPAKAKKTKRCPFNAKHVVPKVEMSFHRMTCPDRAIVDREILHGLL